jgi:hypothetical protein
MGPWSVGDDFKTPVCLVDDGSYYQMPLAYWQQLLTAQVKRVEIEPTKIESQPLVADNKDSISTTEMSLLTVDTLASTLATTRTW